MRRLTLVLIALAVLVVLVALPARANDEWSDSDSEVEADPVAKPAAKKKGAKKAAVKKPAKKKTVLEFPELDVKIVVPKRAMVVRGHVRTRHLIAQKRPLLVRSVLPMSGGRASQLAGTAKCKKKDTKTGKCLDKKQKPAQTPVAGNVFLSEEETVLDREHDTLHDGVDLDEEAALDDQEEAEQEAEQETEEEEEEQDEETDEESMLEVEAQRRKKNKKDKKKKKKKQPRVPVLVSRPSGLVRRELQSGMVGARRSYARRIDAVSSQIHVITPHRRKKDGRKRKIQLAALLDVKGNVVFGAKDTKKKNNKQKKGSKKQQHSSKDAQAASKAATGSAFLEEMMVVSRHDPAAAAQSSLLTNADGLVDMNSLQSNGRYQHQWRLVHDDVNAGWTREPGLPTCAPAADAAPLVRPAQSFGASPAGSASQGRGRAMVTQSFADLPEHTLLQISATFTFMGEWKGQIGYALVDGQHIWLESFGTPTPMPGAPAIQQSQSVPMRIVVPHTAGHVTLAFGAGLTASPSTTTACWGFDDVAISVSH